jgi:hypothetical protein
VSKRADFVKQEFYNKPGNVVGSSSEVRQSALQSMYWNQLRGKCIARFTWEGLPNGIDPRFIENTLMDNGFAIFYYDTFFEMFMCMPATQTSILDIQDNPTAFRVTRNGIYSREVKASECVVIWGNQTRIPDTQVVRIYSERLATVDRTIEIDLLNERNPMIVACSNDQRHTIANVMSKIYDGEPVVWGTENLSMENLAQTIGVFPLNQNAGTGAVSSIKHMESKTRIWGEALTMLGIMNIDSDKRERMVVAEAGANTGQVLASREQFMKPRELACEQINTMFPGLNVSCTWAIDDNANPNLNDILAAENLAQTGGEVGGDAHDKA